MRTLITILLAGCAQEYLPVIEENKVLLIGEQGEQQDFTDVVEEEPSLPTDAPEEAAQPESAPEEPAEPVDPAVFIPGKIDVSPPVDEPEIEPVPGLSMDQVGVSFYDINVLAISRDGTTGMLGMSGGNSCEYSPDIASLLGDDFSAQLCPDIPEE